jgi:hypothetical protein
MARFADAVCVPLVLRDGASRLLGMSAEGLYEPHPEERRRGRRVSKGGRLALLVATILSCADLAHAQAPAAQTPPASAPPAGGGEAAKSVAGAWEISNAERDRSCAVTLRSGARATVAWDAKCAEAFPFSRGVVSWSVGAHDTIMLMDAGGKLVIELSEVEGGLYEGERPGEGLVFLQSAAATERKPEELAGEWSFMRAAGNKPLCRVTLTTTPAAQDGFAVAVRPGCDALITRFRPVAWRYDRGQIVLVPAQGEVWRFEESEPAIWNRIPEQRQPLRLVKQQ